ncbi:hypothetical protein NG799_11150 [Laspinema sp. D1]|uniref:Uncharacterized protein n=1 Tax=Laspinema palackyanum D2a TaxID=2953684 RepID=A0ABT2MQ96_9CYAN|nr:hypothetical protein [Laspinema sp. D2a]
MARLNLFYSFSLSSPSRYTFSGSWTDRPHSRYPQFQITDSAVHERSPNAPHWQSY